MIANSDEKWKSIEGFREYEVSTHGRIRCTETRPGGRAGVLKGWTKSQNGKPIAQLVSLRRSNKTFTFKIHRLVLEAFVGKCPQGMECCHNDGNPLNNRLENLRWDSHHENMLDAVRHGTRTRPPIHQGETHHNTTINADDVIAIRTTPLVRGAKAKLARHYKISQTTIDRIIRREVWKHVGP